jgi:ribosomal protein S18 acetylase RimI-like enzyme
MGLRVATATPDDRPAAARLLAAGRPDPDAAASRHLDLLATGELDPAGLFVARDRSGLVRGAMLAQRVPGALGLAWPPRAGTPAAEDGLAAAACGWLRAGGVKVGQAFAPPHDRAGMAPLERSGFRRVTEVVHLRRGIDPAAGDPGRGPPARARPEEPTPPAGPLELVPYTEADRVVFADTLLATYDGSLDCPELTGDRTPGELLDGFAGPLADRPGWRLLARHWGEPVGVLLFDAGVEPGAVELSYLGLVPAARGRGWGDGLVRRAVRFAARDGAAALTLSVDARNGPARRLYARHGFREHDRRAVYLAAWPGSQER